MTNRYGWGGENANSSYTPNSKNQNPNHTYDLAGNLTNDGRQQFTYDATGQQATASNGALPMGYDGDGLRLKKTESGVTTYYLRSTVLGQQVAAEFTYSNNTVQWQRGYVYLGGQLLAIQDVTQNKVLWAHQEPYSKGQRLTNSSGVIETSIELDPFGGQVFGSQWSWQQGQQPKKYTTYERDGNGSDEAMFRRYNRWHSRFDQPDPYDGSYSLANPQSLNRYGYVENDPVNFVDPTGLLMAGPGQVCFLKISGTHWTWEGGEYTQIHSIERVCFGGGGLSGGYGGTGLAGGGGPGPESPQDPFIAAYNECLSSLGNAPAPGISNTNAIYGIANRTGVDRTLLAVTWHEESRFSANPTNGVHGGKELIGDIGPGQLFPGIWDKSPFTDGLRNPFGTNREARQVFNGNALENLIVTGRALNHPLGAVRGDQRAEAAGLYKAGSKTGPGYQTRVDIFNKYAKGYDAFFECLAKKGF